MKMVTLMRHGKSDWDAPFSTDFERPLKNRGRKDAARMGRFMRDLDLVPELIISSPANRAHNTAELFAEAAGFEDEIEWEGAIYGADSVELVSLLRSASDAYDHVMIVGHNPGLEELCSRLIGTDPYGPAWGIRMPTAAVAHLLLDIVSWNDVQASSGQLQWLTTPRSLKDRQS
jgi:phosphohistidine phosphatase